MRKRHFVVYAIILLLLAYICLIPKITSKPALDVKSNKLLLIEGTEFPYHPEVRFNNHVAWSITTRSDSNDDYRPDVIISPESGEIEWREKSGGLYQVTVIASNWLGSDSQSFDVRHITRPRLEIQLPPVITSGRRFSGSIRVYGSRPVRTGCDNLEIEFSFKDAKESDAVVNWPAPVTGKYSIKFMAENVAGRHQQTWDVSVEEVPVKITSKPIKNAIIGRDYVYNVRASGSPEFRWKLLKCPEGMSIDEKGNIKFEAEYVRQGSYDVRIRVSNVVKGKYCEDTQAFTLNCNSIMDPEITTKKAAKEAAAKAAAAKEAAAKEAVKEEG